MANKYINNLYQFHLKQIVGNIHNILYKKLVNGLIIHSGTSIQNKLQDGNFFFKSSCDFLYLIPCHIENSFIVITNKIDKPQLFIYHQDNPFHNNLKLNKFHYYSYEVILYSDLTKLFEDIKFLLKKNYRIICSKKLEQELSIKNDNIIQNEIREYRQIKTKYEIHCLQEANIIAAKGHIAVQDYYLNNSVISEFDIYIEYTKATQQSFAKIPYNHIIALNKNGSVLHYSGYQNKKEENPSLLIDAGASFYNYCSDITRTYSKNSYFSNLIIQTKEVVNKLIQKCIPNTNFYDIHILAEQLILELLIKNNILINIKLEEAINYNLSKLFFMHNIGHLIGLRVHDIIPPLNKDKKNDFILLDNMVITIEPGIYFSGKNIHFYRYNNKINKYINWTKIEELNSYGGIRYEDNIVIKNTKNILLTHEAFEIAKTLKRN